MKDLPPAAHDLRLILFEPLKEVGDPLTALLRQDGFGATVHAFGLDAVRRLLARREADVLILDLDRNRAAGLGLVQDIRHARLGYDPFTAVLAMQSHPDLASVKAVRAAGFDHMLGKPVATEAVIAHILDLARRPRRFVASAPYTGPDRRTTERPSPGARLLTVQNALAPLAGGAAPDLEKREAEIGRWRQMVAELG